MYVRNGLKLTQVYSWVMETINAHPHFTPVLRQLHRLNYWLKFRRSPIIRKQTILQNKPSFLITS